MFQTRHGKIDFPTFFPDGTQGVVRGVDSVDLNQARIEGLVISIYHLIVNRVIDRLDRFDGIHQFMGWDKPIITDSGGFQVMSLIHNQPNKGKITDEEITFFLNDGQKVVLTPEKSIEMQLKLGTDIAICLDDCTKPDISISEQKKSIERTIAWAKRSKAEFKRLTDGMTQKPKLFAVIQGGSSPELRKYCATELKQIGFDGFCYGGWPINEQRQLLEGILEITADLMPKDLPKYALGVGKPEDIVKCFKMGYQIFDCVIPTREARHKRLYLFNDHSGVETGFYTTISLQQAKYETDKSPLSKLCDCYTCAHYSRAYLYHLFKVKDTLIYRLATIHNLRFYSMLMERLKGLS